MEYKAKIILKRFFWDNYEKDYMKNIIYRVSRLSFKLCDKRNFYNKNMKDRMEILKKLINLRLAKDYLEMKKPSLKDK